MVGSSDGDTDFFDIVIGDLQGKYIGAISLYNWLRLHTSDVNRLKKNGFTLKRQKVNDISQNLLWI